MDIKDLVQRYGVESARIQVGRERLWPAREGIEPSTKAIQTLEAALSGADIKGSVRVTEQDHNRLWISKGEVKQPMDATLKAIAETQVAQTTVVVTESKPAIATPEPTPIELAELQSATVKAVDTPEPEPAIASPEPPSLDSATDAFPEPAEFFSVPPGVRPEELYLDQFQEPAVPEVVSADILPLDLDLEATVEAQGLEPEVESVVSSVDLEISEVEPEIAPPDPISSELVTEAEPGIPSVDLEIGESGSAIATPDPQSEISSADLAVDEIEPAIATQTISQAEPAPTPEPAIASSSVPDTEAQAQPTEQDILAYPQEATNVMNPMAALVRKNLKTFTENVEHPQLKQWGQRLQTLSQSAIPTAKLAAQALGRVIDEISLGSPERLNRAALDAIRIFGKDGVYEGQEFKFENQGGQARISLKSNGTPVFENGQFNHSVPPMQLFKLRDLPEKIEGYMQQVQTKTAQKTQQTTPRRRNLELVS